jgi:hypothetical protein
VTRLANDVAHTVEVQAQNRAGWSTWYAVLAEEVDRTPVPVAPDEVRNVRVRERPSEVQISWSQPRDDGGAAPTYLVQSSPAGVVSWSVIAECADLSARQTRCDWDGFSADDGAYIFRVQASNSQGDSVWVVSDPVTPYTTPDVNSFVDNVAVVGGNGELTVSWVGSDWSDYAQGAEVRRVQVRAVPEGSSRGRVCMVSLRRGELASSCDVTRLANDVAHTVEVQAQNRAGWSTWYAVLAESWEVTPSVERRPEIAGDLSLLGNPEVGETLVLAGGELVGFPRPEVSVRWYRCDADGLPRIIDLEVNCFAIAMADGRNYPVTSLDVGFHVVAEYVATNPLGSVSVVAGPLLVSSAPLFMAGHEFLFDSNSPIQYPIVGRTLGSNVFEGQPGWVAYPEITEQSGQWYRCDDLVPVATSEIPDNCAALPSPVSGILPIELDENDSGKYVTIYVTLTNPVGATPLLMPVSRATAEAISTEVVPELGLPAALFAPADDGIGGTMSVSLGKWAGSPSPSLSVQWVRCDGVVSDPVGVNCQPITGATEVSYTLTSADRERFVTAVVTAENLLGSISYTLPQLEQVGFAPYQMGSEPTVEADVSLQEPLVRAKNLPGWKSHPTATTSSQWHRCDEAATGIAIQDLSGNCTLIEGATDPDGYQSVLADTGKNLVLSITARNEWGEMTSVSDSVGPIFTQDSLPGSPRLSAPSWDSNPFSPSLGLPTVTVENFDEVSWGVTEYEWHLCSADPGVGSLGFPKAASGAQLPDDCQVVDSENSSTLVLQPEFVDKWTVSTVSFETPLRAGQIGRFVIEVPSSAPLESAFFPEILSIAGDFAPRWARDYGEVGVGESVVFEFGSFANCQGQFHWSPTYWCMEFDYSWERNEEGIPGASGSTTDGAIAYEFTAEDIGSSISVAFKARRPFHRPSSGSANFPSAIVVGQLGSSPSPSLGGEAAFGETLTAIVGEWDDGTILNFQWYQDGHPISGAQTDGYTLELDDIGAIVSVEVQGTKTGYQSVTRSVSTASEISLGTLTYSSPLGPRIFGVGRVGETVRISAGSTTNGLQHPNYRWDEGTSLSFQWFRDGARIDSETTTEYLIAPADLDASISVRVTGGKEGYQTVTRATVVTESVLLGILRSSNPIITGNSVVGGLLTASPGAWSVGVTGASQWFRNGTAISDATERTHLLTVDDLGSTISYSLSGSEEGYQSVTRVADVSDLIGVSVSVVGLNRNGTTSSTQSDITAQHIEITGVSFEYQWYVCESRIAAESVSLPVGCAPAHIYNFFNTNKEAFVWGYLGDTPVHAGKYFLAGLKSTYGGNSSWRFSPSTYAITDPPTMRGTISVTPAVESLPGASLPRLSGEYYYWDLVERETLEIDPSSAWSRVSQSTDWEEYEDWQQEGKVDFNFAIPSAVGYPTDIVPSQEWYVCSEAPVNGGLTTLLRRGVDVYDSIPVDCESRGSAGAFKPDVSDAGKYHAVAVTYRNTFFSSTVVFHRSGELVSIAPKLEAAPGAERPRIVGAVEVGSTLEFQATVSGNSEVALEYQWFRCNGEIAAWSHDLPLPGIKVGDLGRKRMELVPVEDPEASWPDEAFRPILVSKYPRCREIVGATGSTYTVTEDDRQSHTNSGAWLTSFVTATNSYGSSSVLAGTTARVSLAPYLEEQTRADGSEIVPKLYCYTNSITNTHCRQHSNYVQGSTTTLVEELPAIASVGAVSAESWRFRGNPIPALSHTWFICERTVPIYSSAIPEHCVEAPGDASSTTAAGRRVFTTRPDWWGSWIVSSYTATNSRGSITRVAATQRLEGEPYAIESDF